MRRGIAAILNPIIAAGRYTVLDRQVTVEQERAFIEAFPARGIFLVATDLADDELVGFQTLEPIAPSYTRAFDHVGVIGTYVAEPRRRQGVAFALFRAMFEAARSGGYEKVTAYVRGDNPEALAAYRSQGFRVIGTARETREDQRRSYIDEVFIEKPL